MEVDVSTIIGYVMKFNYALPYNASYLTDSYVRYDRSISPGVEVDGDDEPLLHFFFREFRRKDQSHLEIILLTQN